MSDVRIFLSFDVEHDGDLYDLLTEQSLRGGSGFAISGHSAGGVVTESWLDRARRRIRDADEVIVICGEHTQDSPRMDAELRVTQEEEKPYFLLWGRREQMCTMPAHVPRNECMYSWTFDSLLELVRTTIRKAEPLQVLEHEKRP